jgi:hypothetical protein
VNIKKIKYLTKEEAANYLFERKQLGIKDK